MALARHDPRAARTIGRVPNVFDRIICGVDGSEAGVEAVRQALRLGAAAGSILAVAVSESHLAVHAGMLASQLTGELDVAAEAALEEVRARAPAIETRLVRGRATDALLSLAGAEGATLAVVGSHEKRRGAGMVLGNVATRMLHDAPCSVLIARPPKDAQQFPSAIVVGVDGSDASLAAVAAAQAISARSSASVTFLAATGGRRQDVDLRSLEDAGLDVTSSGDKPLEALILASERADLLVVGSRGLRGLRSIGSVSERLAHRASCSVLIVREPG
jgi:nucleotide-binding universal stress UspA family protein